MFRRLFNANSLFILICILTFASVTRAQVNRFESEIQRFEVADKTSLPAKNAILFVGSSTIRLWKDLATDFPKQTVINRGFGGSQLSDLNFYLNRIVIPYHPRMILVYAGDNDLAAGKNPADVLNDYKAFVRGVRAKLPNTKIAFISIKPSLARVKLLPQMRETNELIKSFSAKEKSLLFIDIFNPMLDASGQPLANVFIEDGLHMNRSGYEIWRSVIAPYLQP